MALPDTPTSHPAHTPDRETIAVIGDGQLARMMQTAAIEMGLSLKILASDSSTPAAQVCPDTIIGDYTNIDDLMAFCQGASVVTFDHEHVPHDALVELEKNGVNLQPSPSALIYAQDKLAMRRKMEELGLPVPQWDTLSAPSQAADFMRRVGGPIVIKATTGGYDGHGVWFADTPAQAEDLARQALDRGVGLIGEEKIDLTRELSALVARSTTGQIAHWPIVRSVQKDGICTLVEAPARDVDGQLRDDINAMTTTIAQSLGVTGVLAVELLQARDRAGRPVIYINELAMRPHNTGHWTQDGARTSQFEQHLRAITGQELGGSYPIADTTVMVNILGAATRSDIPLVERIARARRRYPDAKIHLYGKTYRPGRKLGHVNVCAGRSDYATERAEAVAEFIETGSWPGNRVYDWGLSAHGYPDTTHLSWPR